MVQKIIISDWLVSVRRRFEIVAPELLPILAVYSSEAVFGRNYISNDLACLEADAKILEIGAGSLLLSCQLVREGFQITALEPIGKGFSHFEKMRELILFEADSQGCRPNILNQPAENIDGVNCYDYAFSINVMEHVNDIASTIKKVGRSLKAGAHYRFTCPNYLFPYEPHFNIPTLFSKNLTEQVFGRRIFDSRTVEDPLGTWRSLNWINPIQIRQIVRNIIDCKVTFNRSMFQLTLERVSLDPEFSARRHPVIRALISLLVRSRVHLLFCLIPAMTQPIIDCRIAKQDHLGRRR